MEESMLSLALQKLNTLHVCISSLHFTIFIVTVSGDQFLDHDLSEYKKLVKQFHYRPEQALKFPDGWGSQISNQSEHEGGKVVSPTHRPPLPPRNIPGIHFC